MIHPCVHDFVPRASCLTHEEVQARIVCAAPDENSPCHRDLVGAKLPRTSEVGALVCWSGHMGR